MVARLWKVFLIDYGEYDNGYAYGNVGYAGLRGCFADFVDCLSVWLRHVQALVAGDEETVETGFVGESSVLIGIDYVFGFVFDLHDCGRVLFDCKDLNVYDDRRLEFNCDCIHAGRIFVLSVLHDVDSRVGVFRRENHLERDF